MTRPTTASRSGCRSARVWGHRIASNSTDGAGSRRTEASRPLRTPFGAVLARMSGANGRAVAVSGDDDGEGGGPAGGRRLVVVAQLFFVARGYWADHREFAFQMFPESSTWQADIVRVTADGSRLPIDEPWSGYRWSDMVVGSGAADSAGSRHHADAGLDNQLAFLDAALDYVADHTPNDRETRVPRGGRHDLAQRRPAGRRRAAERPPVVMPTTARPRRSPGRVRRPWLRRVDDALGRPVSMRAMALLRVLVGPIVLLHLRPLLEDAWRRAAPPRRLPRAVRVVVPGAAARAPTSPCCGSPRSPRWR